MTAKRVRSVPTSDLSQVTLQVPAHRGPMVSMARRESLVFRPESARDVRDRRSSVPGGNDPRPIVKVFVVSALGGGRILLFEARVLARSSLRNRVPKERLPYVSPARIALPQPRHPGPSYMATDLRGSRGLPPR